jgi:hypothetical protein
MIDRMRGLAWGGWVLLLVACTRENGAFDGSGGGGTATTGSGGGGITTGDGADGPQPTTGSASSVDADTADDAPPPTTGPESTSEEGTTTPPQGTTMGSTEEGTTSAVMEGGSSTTGFDLPTTCCMGESCNNPDIADDCVCNLAPECCVPGPWNLYCTAVAVQSCGLLCVPPPGDCCMVNELFAGCDDFEAMVCVCSVASFADCCNIAWTDGCVAYAAENCLQCG